MALILFAMSILWVVVGASLVLKTRATRTFYQQTVSVEKMKRYAIPVIAVGAVLIIGALFSDRMFWWPMILGLLATAKGVYLLRADEDRLQAIWQWWCEEVSEDSLRLLGLITYSLGAALLGYLF